MATALIVAVVLVVGYGVIAFALWRFQERIVFQPPRATDGPDIAGLPRLSYVAADGMHLFAYVVGVQRDGRPPILAFHGNAVLARWLVPWAREVARRLDVCVVVAEYRGYDGLSGTPTYEGSRLDARAALTAASAELHVKPSDFLLYGHSLGTAIATELAGTGVGRSLILQSPFTSARDMVSRWPVVGVRAGWSLVSRVHYDTLDLVRRLEIPVFVTHGQQDLVIPAWMGQAVFSAARVPGRLLLVKGAGHNDVVEIGGEEYWKWMAAAIDG